MYQLIIDNAIIATYSTYPLKQAVALANSERKTVAIWEPDEGETVLTVYPA